MSKFLGCKRGSVAVMTGLTLVPLMLSIGLGLDAARMYLTQERLSFALDAAGLAAGTSMGTDAQAEALGRTVFNANFQTGWATLTSFSMSMNNGIITTTGTAQINSTFMSLGGFTTLNISATSQVTHSMGLEVALVLDNTGSMMWPTNVDAGSNMAALKVAAGTLVTQLFGSATTNNAYLRVALVPYVAAVNPGSVAPLMVAGAPPLDTADANGWLGCVVERPSTFQNFSTAPSYTAVAADLDTPANSTNGYLTQYYWPAEILQTPAQPTTSKCLDPAHPNNIVSNGNCNNYTQLPITTLPNYAWGSNAVIGPNRSCPTPVVPLTNNLAPLTDAIGVNTDGSAVIGNGWGPVSKGGTGMGAWDNGGTMGSIGMAWGYRVLSPKGPYATVSTVNAWSTPQWKKAVVLMTDGINDFNQNQYTGFGKYQPNFNPALVDAQEEAVCDALRAQGAVIFSVFFNSGSTAGPAISYCAGTAVGSGDPSYYYNAQSQSDLAAAFADITGRLNNLRVSQ